MMSINCLSSQIKLTFKNSRGVRDGKMHKTDKCWNVLQSFPTHPWHDAVVGDSPFLPIYQPTFFLLQKKRDMRSDTTETSSPLYSQRIPFIIVNESGPAVLQLKIVISTSWSSSWGRNPMWQTTDAEHQEEREEWMEWNDQKSQESTAVCIPCPTHSPSVKRMSFSLLSSLWL